MGHWLFWLDCVGVKQVFAEPAYNCGHGRYLCHAAAWRFRTNLLNRCAVKLFARLHALANWQHSAQSLKIMVQSCKTP